MPHILIHDPNEVPYEGKILPKDAVPYRPNPVDVNVPYNGKILPGQAVPFVPAIKDLTNNPSLLIVGGITCPSDTIIYLTGNKIIAMSNILDGVSVFEHISRRPYELEFEFVVRQKSADGNGYVFPQDDFYNIWTKIWIPNSVLTLQNTYLNKLGIQEIVVQNMSPTTVRGTKNLPVKFQAWENVPGQSLIIG